MLDMEVTLAAPLELEGTRSLILLAWAEKQRGLCIFDTRGACVFGIGVVARSQAPRQSGIEEFSRTGMFSLNRLLLQPFSSAEP